MMKELSLKGLSEARLAIRVASFCGHRYVLMDARERAESGLPVTRADMLAFLIMKI